MNIKQIFEEHRLWLEGKGGSRADLRGAYLYWVDLKWANTFNTKFYGVWFGSRFSKLRDDIEFRVGARINNDINEIVNNE